MFYSKSSKCNVSQSLFYRKIINQNFYDTNHKDKFQQIILRTIYIRQILILSFEMNNRMCERRNCKRQAKEKATPCDQNHSVVTYFHDKEK